MLQIFKPSLVKGETFENFSVTFCFVISTFAAIRSFDRCTFPFFVDPT